MEDSDKFDRIDDEELLTLVQRQTFSYFWISGILIVVWRVKEALQQIR